MRKTRSSADSALVIFRPESRLAPNVVIEERMANTASARKRIRQTVTRTARNQAGSLACARLSKRSKPR